MDIGIGLDATLNLSFADQAVLSQEAARLGYTSIWTPESTGQDAFQLCSQRWAASCQVLVEGLTTGIGVSPVLYRTPIAFAMSGGTVSQLTGGRFIMGIGAGGAYRPRTRPDPWPARTLNAGLDAGLPHDRAQTGRRR